MTDKLSEANQVELLRQRGSTWYDPAHEYSSLFERRFDLQRQRRVFVESEVAGKTPSIGYAYLTSLIEQGHFNTVFTTNFDDLINEAFYLFSNDRPIVCAHDSSINSVTVTSKRPKVIKLHGDYLFDDLKSTIRETESLEQNMKAKLAEFSKDHGLIVVGYSGADRSIMENLQALLRREEYLKTGIYWCLRKDTEISEDLRKLLLRDRVYFVEIDGFDELFAELYGSFNPGQCVPESALGINRRSNQGLTMLLASSTGVPTTTEILKKARIRLERQSKRSALANLIAGDTDDDRTSIGENFTDDEMLLLGGLSDLMASEQYAETLEKAKKALAKSPRPKIRRRLIEQCINAHMARGDQAAAMTAADEIIKLHPKRAASYLRKARLLANRSERLIEIQRAIDVDPYAITPRIQLCETKIQQARGKYGAERAKLLEEATIAAEVALRINPSTSNSAWSSLFEAIELKEFDSQRRDLATLALITKLVDQNPYASQTLELQRQRYSTQKDAEKKAGLELLLNNINIAEERYLDEHLAFARTRLRALKSLGDETALRQELEKLTEDINRDPDLAALAASILREAFGDDEAAIRLLRDSLRASKFDWEVLTQLIDTLCDLERIEEAQQLFDKWGHRLNKKWKHTMTLALLDAKKDFHECLKESARYFEETGESDITMQAYYLLSAGDYKAAEKQLREFLAPINYTAEAGTEIVNFELSRKLGNAKPDRARLEKVLQFSNCERTKVGVLAVLEERKLLQGAIKKAVEVDKTNRFSIIRWPAMKPYLTDPGIASLLKTL
ncbi:MAG: SIR2 family protein [Roseateles sp.]